MCLLRTCFIVTLIGGILGDIVLTPEVDEAELYVNSTYIVTCKGYNNANTTWKGPNGAIIDNNKGRVHVEESRIPDGHQSVLVFERISRDDKGNYTCSTIINGQLKKTSFKLMVVKPITFMGQLQKQNLIEGQNMMVRCEVTGDPSPTIMWQIKGKTYSPKTEGSTKYLQMPLGLYINNVTRDDEGSYLCRAFQITAKTSNLREQSIYVTVAQKPRWPNNWKGEKEFAYGYMGGMANLTCKAFGRPTPGYAWTRRNKTIDPKYSIIIREEYHSVLQVKMVDHKVLGDYECLADNGVGSIWKKFTLLEGIKPLPPNHVSLKYVSAESASVEIDSTDRQEVLGYRLQFVKADQWLPLTWESPDYQDVSLTESEDGMLFHIICLAPKTEYRFRVATRTASGLSDFTADLGFTTTSGASKLSGLLVLVVCAYLY